MAKKIFFILVSLSIVLSGCGGKKDEKSPSAPLSDNIMSSPYTFNSTISTFSDFKNYVSSNQFIAFPYNNISYYFTSTSSSDDNCENFLGFINFCSSFNSDWNTSHVSTHNKTNNTYVHPMGTNASSIVNGLMELINSATENQSEGTGCWRIRSNNILYGICLNYPLAANPVYKMHVDGSGYVFYNWKAQ